uniref:26S proteasome regulatory subunit 4 homolog n=1 Tax=Hirondellea gigas TaxID=1518452 RepID=A0A6A7G6K5_9CRUS
MGNQPGGAGGKPPDGGDKKKEKKWEPPLPTRVGRKKKRVKGSKAVAKLPQVTPLTKCKLRQLRLERIKDYLLLEQDFVREQESESEAKGDDTKEDEERNKLEELRGPVMSVGHIEEIIDDNHAIVSSNAGPQYYVNMLSFVDKDLIEPGCTVLLHFKAMSVVGILDDDVDPMVNVMKVEKAPLESYADVGGLEAQIQEVKEAVELPMSHPELYDDIGIKPPKGVIFYGAPGTGKTLLAKAVANETSATFLRIVGSELIQKYLGDGPKLVRELFKVAEENAPSIVFIDEIDAVGTKRYASNSGGTREVQRTMLELLNQLDGFDARGEVKVIMATNRIETLDPALLRPGRIDRKIEFPMPDITTKRRIFNIHVGKMSLAEDVDLEEFIMTKGDLSGADIKAMCTEAGLLALRERRMQVSQADFRKAKEVALYRKKGTVPEGLYL